MLIAMLYINTDMNNIIITTTTVNVYIVYDSCWLITIF